jgi:hypothetical protein
VPSCETCTPSYARCDDLSFDEDEDVCFGRLRPMLGESMGSFDMSDEGGVDGRGKEGRMEV